MEFRQTPLKNHEIWTFYFFVDSYPHLLTDGCWDIANGKKFKEFQNWGLLYTVEFEITVTNAGSGWTNVFHFTANENNGNYGDRIPALFINSAHTTKKSSKCPENGCKSMNESDDLAHTYF